MPAPDAPRVMRSPRTVDIELTARCNLRCRYCYFFNNPAVDYRDLPTGEWLQFFEELGRLGVMDLTLAGGEPFARSDLRELLTGVVQNRMRYSLLSNGGLIDDDLAEFIARTGRCDNVQISLDGASPATHDTARGAGAFEGAVRGLRTLQRHGVRVAVRITLHRNNVHALDQTVAFVLEELGLASVSLNAAGYLGTCRQNADELLLTTADRQEAMASLVQLSAKYPGRLQAAAGPLAEARMWVKMERARAEGAPPSANGGHLTGCGCTFSKIAVRADGVITPCNMLPHLELGRINRDALADVWQQHATLVDLRARGSTPLAQFDFCAGCAYQPYCSGNCPGLAYTLTGQVNHPSPDACLRAFLQAGGALPDA